MTAAATSAPAPASLAYRESLAEVFLAKLQHGHGRATDSTKGATDSPESNLESVMASEPFANFVQAQLTWDRAMAEALATAKKDNATALIVGVMGRGHIDHGYGVPHQLSDKDFAEKLFALLSRHGFPPARLEIEITEDALVVDVVATRRCIRKLKERGVRVVLDDFGTGYSSLRQLRELPFDRVKIDRSFIAGVGSDRQSEEIVVSTINLCRALGLKTVAEGIEDQVQADWICAHGADAAQGFFYARPVSAEEVLDKLKGLNPRS